MNKPSQPSLTKTCVNCGQQKPLTAFLEMSVTQGTSYGNVCSSCRKTAMEMSERRKKTEAEGSTTSETGHKIDSKTKVHEAVGRREQNLEIEEKYHKERDLKDKISADTIEKKQHVEHKEKKHRSEFLQKRPVKSGSNNTPSKSFGAETSARETQNNAATAQQTQETHEEKKRTDHDFSVPYQGQQVAGQIRFSGQVFQQFRQWLGNSAPIVTNVNQTVKEAAPKQSGAITQATHQVKDSEAAAGKSAPVKEPKDPAIEFIEKNWRPGSKR